MAGFSDRFQMFGTYKVPQPWKGNNMKTMTKEMEKMMTESMKKDMKKKKMPKKGMK